MDIASSEPAGGPERLLKCSQAVDHSAMGYAYTGTVYMLCQLYPTLCGKQERLILRSGISSAKLPEWILLPYQTDIDGAVRPS